MRLRAISEIAMSTQNDIIGAMKQQTSGPSRRAVIASGVATATCENVTYALAITKSIAVPKNSLSLKYLYGSFLKDIYPLSLLRTLVSCAAGIKAMKR
jgi:hypothetical protein